MKKLLLLLLVSAMSFEINAQTNDDPVIMHINGNAITRSEFEYSFNKNNSDGVLDKKGLEEYVDLFINLFYHFCKSIQTSSLLQSGYLFFPKYTKSHMYQKANPKAYK